MITEAFWLVWNPAGQAPTHRHDTPSSAKREAERLARLNPGEQFIVLQSLASRCVDSMQKHDLRPPGLQVDEIPF